MTRASFTSKDTFSVNNFTTISASNGQITVGSNVTINTSSVSIGNSSVNSIVNSSSLTIGSVVHNSSSIAVGSNVVINTSTVFVGNSSVNNTINTTSLTIGTNSTFNSAIFVNNVASNGTAYVSNGFYVTPGNWGVINANVTMSASNGNYQYATTNAAFTWTAPTTDCAIDILITNGSGAGTITFSGFTVQSGGTGDTYATTNSNKYLISVRRINSISTYLIKALQ